MRRTRTPTWLWVSVLLAAGIHVVGGCGHGSRSASATRPPDITPLALPDWGTGISGMGAIPRGGPDAIAKLSPDLAILLDGAAASRQPRAEVTDKLANPAAALRTISASPKISRDGAEHAEVVLDLKDAAGALPTDQALAAAGAVVRIREGSMVFATVPLAKVKELAALPGVAAISLVRGSRLPPLPGPAGTPATIPGGRPRGPGPNAPFDPKGLTGQGVIIAVIDSGMDWRHEDFIRPDGTSRILAIWDPHDDSFAASDGKTGSAPPAELEGKPLGTVYTNDQINAALQGKGTVNTRDLIGHGTAVAGAAAGNGRATANGVAPGTYKGVAPDADLLVVRVLPEGHAELTNIVHYATDWAVKFARRANRPCVVNLSLGGHFSAHDGSEPEERFYTEVLAASRGLAICIAAGNEGNASFHAAGRFGPRRPGQMDVAGNPVELFVRQQTFLLAYVAADEEWGLAVRGAGPDGFVDAAGQPAAFYVERNGAVRRWHFDRVPAGMPDPRPFGDQILKWIKVIPGDQRGGGSEQLLIPLLPGRYIVFGYGPTENVRTGRFDLYLPDASGATFGYGGDRRQQVGSPGNASGPITVASYDFQAEWQNLEGSLTRYNLETGRISDYSSPGFRRDGLIKPDVAAPGRYMISSLAEGSRMALLPPDLKEQNKWMITRDARHIAWSGTSASTPYAAGVVALMLQKNPTLAAADIKRILIESADKGDSPIGAAPNVEWGYGRLNPARALANTPPPQR